jgi:hypothetical protein
MQVQNINTYLSSLKINLSKNVFYYFKGGTFMRKFLAVLVVFFVSIQLCLSSTPNKIKYQGILKEKGASVTGTKTMKFRITNSDGATEYWTSGNVSVDVAQGAFSYTLEV